LDAHLEHRVALSFGKCLHSLFLTFPNGVDDPPLC
jgi:hypothetical protein